MKLTEKQIQQLFDFTLKKHVRYYDLQLEIVDHLAEQIEEQMTADKSILFEDALKNVYRGFGIFGFSKIVQEKESQLYRKYRNQWWRELYNLVRWPETLFSLALVSILWMIVSNVNPLAISVIFMAGWLVCLVLLNRMQRYRNTKGKQLLMVQYSPSFNSMFVYCYHFIFFTIKDITNPYIFTGILFIGVLIQVANFRIIMKIKNEAYRLYPEAFA